MVDAIVVSKLLMIIEMRAHVDNETKNVYLLFDDLKRVDLSPDEAKQALVVLTTKVGYKCIKVVDDKSEKQVWIGIDLLSNFHEIRSAFLQYINYVRDEEKAQERFGDVNWSALEKQFRTKDSNVYWGQDAISSKPRLRRIQENYNSVLKLVGNDVVIEFSGDAYTIIKTLRTDQAPFFFLKYLMLHPEQVIPKSVIQTEVEMCAQKNDMTELVRQCGFHKSLKEHFFKGTTKDKVRLTPYANIPLDTAFEGEV